MAQRARAHTNVPVDLVPVDLVAQNKELEERVQQLQARCDQLERDLAVEKLEGAQRSAEELKKQVTRTIRFLSAGIAFPLSLVFYYYAWPALNGRPHEQIVHGYALFLISTPLGQCGMLLSILPNDEKLARLMSTVPSVIGVAFPAAALVVATVRNVQLHWPNCADSSGKIRGTHRPASGAAAGRPGTTSGEMRSRNRGRRTPPGARPAALGAEQTIGRTRGSGRPRASRLARARRGS